MASIGAAAAISTYGLTFAGTTSTGAVGALGTGFIPMGVGLGLLAVGGLIDGKIIAGLGGRGKSQWEPPRLVDMAGISVGQGEPSIWAIGRVRVQAHVMWQSEKVRQQSAGGLKAGTDVQMKRVTVDSAIAVNERLTNQLVQLVGGGKLLLFTTRNIVTVRSSEITVSTSGGRLVLTMQNTLVPDFTNKFDVDDIVILSGFVPAGGSPNINGTYWKVQAVTAHTSTPSVLTLDIYQGQTLAGLNSTAGIPAAPAEIARVDDALVQHAWSVTAFDPLGTGNVARASLIFSGNHPQPNQVFAPGDFVLLSGWTPSGWNGRWRVTIATDIGLGIIPVQPGVNPSLRPIPFSTGVPGTSTNAGRINFETTPTTGGGLFPIGFNPAAHFYAGTETQGEDSIITDVVGVGNVGGFRGVAYQVLDDMDCTLWNGLPPQLEGLLDTGPENYATAIKQVLERAGIPAQFIDVSGVTPTPFEGMYLRGPVPGAVAVQSLLVVAQAATQVRDGNVVVFDIDNADVIQIPNEDFIAGPSGEKWEWEDMAREDLPTSIGVRHQDPDNLYTDGYQTRGNRHPSAETHENRNELNLLNIGMTRKQAHELCGTVMRRTYVNARQVRYTLPPSYIHTLENDLHTFTDDEGNDHLCRVIRRDIGANLLVQVTAVMEEVDIAARGSPVQSTAGNAPNPFVQLAEVVGVVLDIPPLRNDEGLTPGLLVAAAAQDDGRWAGCNVHVTSNGGTDWTPVAAISRPTCIGLTTSVFDGVAASAEAHGTTTITWDAVTTLDVEFDSDGTIAPVTLPEAMVLAGFNWYAVTDANGTEIIGVRDVLQTGTRKYTFSYLLRGLRGTRRDADKAAGSRIVQVTFLSQLDGRYLDMQGQNKTLEFRFVAPGRDIESTVSVPMQANWRNCLPMPVREITKVIGASPFNARFSFAHWTRENRPLGNAGPYPLDETIEEYLVTIYDPTGSTAKRTWTVTARGTGTNKIRDRWVDYTSTMQTQDGYTPASNETFWIDVQQVGDFGIGPSNKQEL